MLRSIPSCRGHRLTKVARQGLPCFVHVSNFRNSRRVGPIRAGQSVLECCRRWGPRSVSAIADGVMSKNEKIATIKGKFRTGTKATSLAKDTPGIFKFKLNSGAAHVSVAIRHSLRYLFAHLGPTRSAPKRESGGTLSQNCKPGVQNRAWRKLLTLIRF